MTSSHSTRRRSQHGVAWVVGASLVAHAVIIATASVAANNSVVHEIERGAKAGVAQPYEYSCWTDAMLALTTREIACTVPGFGGQTCAATVGQDFKFDWLLCDGLQEAPLADALAFLTPAEVEALEPMPLVDVPEQEELELAKLLEEEVQKKEEQAQERISDPRQAGQVIEVTAPELEAVAERARFLSEFDSHVKRESVARGSTEKMVERPASKALAVASEAEPAPDKLEKLADPDSKTSEGSGNDTGDSALLAMRAQQFRSTQHAGELGESEGLWGANTKKGDGRDDVRGQEEREGREAAGGSSGASVPNLRPSNDSLSRIVGGGSVDKLDGVESGELTALNTKKWKFASFFNRMKRQVAQNWHPDQVYLRRDPTGKVYGTKNRVTVLEVALAPGGKLAKVVVLKESGVAFLDAEAIAAFERAQPFPNPPTGLISDSSGLITFSFGFHFQVGSPRSGWKLFRQR